MSCCRDRISDLPDEILGKILSLLPTKTAASTSVLCKRWKNVLVLVDTLSFDESMVVYPNEEEAESGSYRFLDFVDKTFALLNNSPTKNKMKKLSMSHRGRFNNCPRVYDWIFTAMEQGGLLEEVDLACTRYGIRLERKLLTSNTLVKLTLSREYCLEVERVFFPALKSLSLLIVGGLDYDNYLRLLKGCPVLEELFITDIFADAAYPYPPCCTTGVESASIKGLVVHLDMPYGSYNQSFQKFHDQIYFQAPSLVYLDYSSHVSMDYQFVDLDSLVEVRLNLKLWDEKPNKPIFGDVTTLAAGISNVTTLHMSPDSLEAFHFCCKSMPVFNNLLNLSIESNKKKGWQVIPLLLKSCPNLHTLLIKGLVHRITDECGDACACTPKKSKVICCLWTCQVKVLEISEYKGSFQEVKQMRHFLGKLECLETVRVGLDADKNNNSEFLRANLLSLAISSSKCKLIFDAF